MVTFLVFWLLEYLILRCWLCKFGKNALATCASKILHRKNEQQKRQAQKRGENDRKINKDENKDWIGRETYLKRAQWDGSGESDKWEELRETDSIEWLSVTSTGEWLHDWQLDRPTTSSRCDILFQLFATWETWTGVWEYRKTTTMERGNKRV